MRLLTALVQGLTGTGSHRAADRIPQLEADRDYWRAVALEARAKLAHADRLITTVCEEKSALAFENARLREELATLTEGHGLLLDDCDELAARLIEARQDLANATPVSVPAPADHAPAIPGAEAEATQELRFCGPLWDINALTTTAKAAA